MHIFPRWVNLDDRVLFPRPRNTWLHNGMSGLLHTSRKLCTQACGCRRTLQYRDDDLLPHVSYESPHVLQHVLTSHFAWQGIWVRLAHGTCQKGPVLVIRVPRRHSCIARPRTRTVAGYSDRCAWQCSNHDPEPRVPRPFGPRSHNHFLSCRPHNVMHSSLRDHLACFRSNRYNIKIYGRGRLQRQRRLGEGRGLTLAYSIGIPLGVVVGLGMLVFCGYICTRSGTKEIVDAAANGGRRNQSTRL